MKDRMYFGFVVGLIAGIPLSIWTLFSYYVLDFTQTRMFDYASEILFGRLPLNALESIIAWLGQMVFCGFVGIGYAYLIPIVTSRHYLAKGWIYSAFIWFSSYAIATLFKMPDLFYTAPYTVVSNFIGASIYGLVLAEATKRLISTPKRHGN
ncbi:hypothetical protein [Desulfosporosinus hippei]|uniref:DUF1440 domain-containing protein n=1 Tax=Desulfosporosinus hippei DSM 8344 TaxID=1121419 RepID=A0A1G8F1E3_9FIRM|nr:hypothetical protein [Desulfosporosinus hippei]SDH75951.1 hypothetical protein SAMN05443529_11872 [Desulfosporosinus hippei DSM 8344]